MADIAHIELTRRRFVTHPILLQSNRSSKMTLQSNSSSEMSKSNQSPTMGQMPKVAHGLAIYVSTDTGLQPETAGFQEFKTKIGIDHLAQKGVAWLIVRHRSARLAIWTMHPQAYQALLTQKSGRLGQEPPSFQQLLQLGLQEQQQLGGYPNSIRRTHQSQFRQVAELMQLVNQQYGPFRLVLVTGDMNVNRYDAEPDSKEETDRITASRCCSSELTEMLQTLQLRAPPILRNSHPFTWNGQDNDNAKPLTRARGNLGWIDYVLYWRGALGPIRMFSWVVQPKTDRPFPELARFWTKRCHRLRMEALANGNGNSELTELILAFDQRMQRGQLQLKRALKGTLKGTLKVPIGSQLWATYVRQLPFSVSDQLWKGLDFYGWHKDDIAVRLIGFDRTEPPIGSPHGFRMIRDISDHYAVMSLVSL